MYSVVKVKETITRPFPKLMIATTGSGNVYYMESADFGVCIAQGDHGGFVRGKGIPLATGAVIRDTDQLTDFIGKVTIMNGHKEATDRYCRPAITYSSVNGIVYLNFEGTRNVILKRGFKPGIICSTPGMTVTDNRFFCKPYNQPVTLTQE